MKKKEMIDLKNETFNAEAAALKDMMGEFDGRPLIDFDSSFDLDMFYHDSENCMEEEFYKELDFEYNGEYYAPTA